MSTAGTPFETSKEFKDNQGTTYPVGTKVAFVEDKKPTDSSVKPAYKVHVIGSTPLHQKIVWINADELKNLNAQALAFINAEARSHG